MDEENKTMGMRIKTIGNYFDAPKKNVKKNVEEAYYEESQFEETKALGKSCKENVIPRTLGATNTLKEACYEVPESEETEKSEVIEKARKENVKSQKLQTVLKATALTAIVIACIILGYIVTNAAINELKRTFKVEQQEIIKSIHDLRNSIYDTKTKHGELGNILNASDCLDVLEATEVVPSCGIYAIQLRKSHRIIPVMCDMTTNGGGWTVFQYRFSGDEEFNRTFAEYNSGFGSIPGEFWLGLETIYEMTDLTNSEVYFEFIDVNGDVAIERFSDFRISAGPGYELQLGHLIEKNDSVYSKEIITLNRGQKFSTKDKDQDSLPNDSCAERCHGGWWYNRCSYINPNGHYATPGSLSPYDGGWGGMINYGWKKRLSLKSTKLMFRRIL